MQRRVRHVYISCYVEAKEQFNPTMLTRIKVCLLLGLVSGPGMFGADFAMKVTDKNYLDRGLAYFSTTAPTIPFS